MPGPVAEPGRADLEHRAVAAAGELGGEGRADRVEQQVAGLADAAADHDDRRVEHGGQGGDALAEPAAQLGELLDGERVAVLRRRAVISGPVIASGSPPARSSRSPASSEPPRAAARASRTSAEPLAYCSRQPRLPQPHRHAVRHDPQVADLGADAEGAAVQRAVEHDAAADAGADGDQQQVVDVVAGAEGELAPRRGVGVVLDDDRQVDALLELGPEVDVAPGDVGREHDHGARLVDVAGGADADRGRCRGASAAR